MAQAPHHPGDGADFVRRIVADPKNVPDVMLLYGYPGASSEEGHERLYLSPDLSNYVEVPEKAILHRAQSAKEQDPQGGVTLWVTKDAKLSYKMAPAQAAAQQALAYYFAGAIQAGGAGQAGPQPLPPQTLPNALCPPVTLPDPCRLTANINCPTHQVTCAATCHATCVATCAGHATCGVTCAATCAATCPPHATCGVTCLATCIATCHVTCVATCAQHATCGVTCHATCPPYATCVPECTHATPCVLTREQPQCPYPTEICTHVAAQCTHAVNCPLPQAAQAGMAAEAQVGCALGTVHASLQVACSIACPTRYGTCNPQCWVTRYVGCTVNPECYVTRYATCQVTCNPEVCWVTRLCPVQTAACPNQTAACPVSLGCPGPGPGPVPFMDPQTMALGHTCPCQMTPWCAQ